MNHAPPAYDFGRLLKGRDFVVDRRHDVAEIIVKQPEREPVVVPVRDGSETLEAYMQRVALDAGTRWMQRHRIVGVHLPVAFYDTVGRALFASLASAVPADPIDHWRPKIGERVLVVNNEHYTKSAGTVTAIEPRTRGSHDLLYIVRHDTKPFWLQFARETCALKDLEPCDG